MIWVVLTMFPVFLRKNNFLGPRPLPWSARTQKIFFSQKPLKTGFEHFLSGFTWYCVLKNFFYYYHIRSVLGWVSPSSKIFCFYLDDLSSPNAKFECFSGFWFLIFGQPWADCWQSRPAQQPKLKKINFNINKIGVVLTMFRCFFAKNIFSDQDPSLGRPEP